MNKGITTLALLLLTCGIYYYRSVLSASTTPIHVVAPINVPSSGFEATYKPAAAQLMVVKKMITKNHYNNTTVFMVDMKIPSSKKRFFIYNLKKDSIIDAGLVAHGRCGEKWLEGRKYSNEPGSMCTSLGKYKIGKPYYGRFGLAYTLYGLDSTNNKALERHVVLHAYECVPETEVDYEICQSDGCPMVSKGFLQKLQKIIDHSKVPILLSVYESR